jgi:hypothetical protein
MTAMETSLGEAFSEPAADVRSYIAPTRSQKGVNLAAGAQAPAAPRTTFLSVWRSAGSS